MGGYENSNERIAKNTLALYARSIIVMLVSLYTSRIVLKTLGADDFGIYNIVGTVVVLFSFIQGAMATAVQRYLNFELGRDDKNAVSRIFSISMTVHLMIALIVVILSETVGLWFLNTQMQIPPERHTAAQWAYQFSVLTCCVNILRIPYNASIIAYEKMSFYAYVSILEVILKLGVVFLLVLSNGDRLILYSALMLIVTIIISIAYMVFCHRKFTTCNFSLFWDKQLFIEIFGFSAWSLFGSMANLGASQGINVLLNIFCGVAVNAAMGLAQQVNSAVNQFITNFQTAFAPQLVKLYARNQQEEFIRLIFRSSKLSYFLILLIGLPVLAYTRPLLSIWLHNVPEYTIQFTRLMILFSMIDALSGPLWNSVQATGKIRNYQILMSSIIALNVPAAYVILKLGGNPITVLAVRVLINFVTHAVRVIYLNRLFEFPSLAYIRNIMFRIILVSALTLPLPLLMSYKIPSPPIWMLLLFLILIVFQTAALVFIFGLSKDERGAIVSGVRQKISMYI